MMYSWRKPAFRDAETGVYSHNYFIEALNREWQKHLTMQQGLALLYLRTNLDETTNSAPLIKKFSTKLKQQLFRSNDLISRHEKGSFTIGIFNVDDLGMKAVLKRVTGAVNDIKNNINDRKFECDITVAHCSPTTDIHADNIFTQVQQTAEVLARQPQKKLEIIYCK